MASNERVCQQNKIKVLCPLDPFSMYLYVRIYFIQFTCWNQWQIFFFHSQRLYQERHFNAQYHNIKFYSIFSIILFLNWNQRKASEFSPFLLSGDGIHLLKYFGEKIFVVILFEFTLPFQMLGTLFVPKMEVFSVKFIIKV